MPPPRPPVARAAPTQQPALQSVVKVTVQSPPLLSGRFVGAAGLPREPPRSASAYFLVLGSVFASAILRTDEDTLRPVTALRETIAFAADFCALDTITRLAMAIPWVEGFLCRGYVGPGPDLENVVCVKVDLYGLTSGAQLV